MDFGWTEEQEAFRDRVVRFAQGELNDDVVRRDAEGAFSPEAWQKCARFGIQGLPVPREYGGGGAGPLDIVLALEALGYGCMDNGLLFSLNAHMWSAEIPVLRFGSDEQKRKYLPGLCDGSLIGVQAMTEPGSGSDAFSLATVAEPTTSGYALTGSKTFITNAPVAGVFVVFASIDRSMGWAGVSAFLVDRDVPGLTVGPAVDKMGLRTASMSELFLDDCVLPETAVLGRPGAGMGIFNSSMDWERSFILAATTGVMERQLERCIAYARARRQFGRPIGKFQGVANRLVDMKLRLNHCKLALYRLAWLREQGRRTTSESAEVKLAISEAFLQSSLDAQYIHGAYGYMTENGLERDVRDAIASRIYSGTSDIQRNIIAGSMGL